MDLWRSTSLVLVSITLVGLAAGCGSGGAGPSTDGGSPAGGEVVLHDADNGKPVSLSTGQTLVVTLPSNRTTGFSWSVTQNGAPQLAQQGEPEYATEAAGTGRVGAGGTDTFRFNAAQAGAGTLTLEYSRPFEQGQQPAQTFTVPVTVK